MKKKLVLLSFLICSILCLFGCNNDPYKNMNIVSTVKDEIVQLNISEQKVGGVSTYSFDTYSFDVQVKDVGGDISREIVVSGGQGLIDCDTVYKGNGITTVTVTPINHDKTGKFTLNIQTVEGNKSISIDFKVDLKINSFFINEDNLKVLSKGQEINLSGLSEFINFDPIDTTQKDIKFEVVTPVNGIIDGYTDSKYVYDELTAGTYAKVENNVLKTFSGVEYPKKVESVIVDGTESYVYTQCVTLRASYVGGDAITLDEEGNVVAKRIPDRFVDIEIIEDCKNVQLLMNYQINNDVSYVGDGVSFPIEKNDKGEYDVTLLNPNYRAGVQYDTYYIERDLMFDFGVATESYNPNDYFVETETVLETSNKPIVLSYSSIDNSFKVQAQQSGNYKHVFKMDHVRYPNIIDEEIVVNFHVLDLPTDIKINGNVIQDSYKVYDYYVNSYGTRFNVDLNNQNGDFNYFLFLKQEDLKDKLHIYKGDGTEQLFATVEELDGVPTITSEQFSNFKDNQTFYLRHSFDVLPEEEIYVYIGVQYSVAANSYSSEVKNNYFISDYLEFPIKLSFETGVKNISFTKSKYMVDVTNPLYNDGIQNYDGIKLFDLPKGQTLESSIATNGITYDHNLINVYSLYDEEEKITSVFMKANNQNLVGKTNVTVKTINGLSKSVQVETFIPTIYAENLSLEDESYYMPLGVEFDEDIPLFYFTGKSTTNPQEQFSLYKTTELGQEFWGNYNSISRLFLLNGSSLNIKFLDYLLTTNSDGEKFVNPIDVTSKVNVTFSYEGYASYSNGRITANKVTESISNPVIMIVSYLGGLMTTNDEGVEEYQTTKVNLVVELYIYEALEGIKLTSQGNANIYIDDFLGMYDKNLSQHTITSNFKPNRLDLGSDWNSVWADETGSTVKPIKLFYDLDEIMDRYIYDDKGYPFIISSLDGKKSYQLKYKDIFEKVENQNSEDYTCTIKCRVGSELMSWISTNSGYMKEDYEFYMKSNIFNRNITLVVNIYATQFSKFSNISSVKITAGLADKVTSFDLDIADDGVYFEIDASTNQLQTKKIAYEINSNAVNKNIRLFNSVNSTFVATINPSSDGNSGVIDIKAGSIAGVKYLTAVPEDNIKGIDEVTGKYIYYDESLVQEFRVMVSDGSQEYPYEIRTVADFNAMQLNVRNNKYNYYILTKNINIAEVNLLQLNFNENNANIFSLDGKYSYIRNGKEINVYSKLYNLNIKQTINANNDIYLGLFGKITSNVILRNLSVLNANIDIRINALNGNNLYVGILAGSANSSKVYNTQVLGSIKISNFATENNSSNINVGGMFGETLNVLISGLPATYQRGISNSSYNSNVNIDYTSNNISHDVLNNYSYNIGGIIGIDNNPSRLMDLNILPTIKGVNYNCSVGGVVGYSSNSTLQNLQVYPKIWIYDTNEDSDNVMNIGGIVGSGSSIQSTSDSRILIKNSKVIFAKENTNDWKTNVGIYLNTSSLVNVGGFIGFANMSDIGAYYSYVRSFHTSEISNNYRGNYYIDALGQVGGLIGNLNGEKLTMASCYFDGDIVANKDAKVGLIGANLNTIESSIVNSYAIGYLYQINGTTLSAVDNVLNEAGMISNIALDSTTENVFTAIVSPSATLKAASISNLQIEDVYTIINNNIYYFAEDDVICGLYEENKTLTDIVYIGLNSSNIGEMLKNYLGYDLVIDDENASATPNNDWLWNIGANIAANLAFPVLFNEDSSSVMYQIVPESIVIDRINTTTGLYNISYDDQIQLLLFVNKTETIIKEDYYEISIDDETSSISIRFNGQTIVTRYLEITSDIEILENTNGYIVSLVGSKIYPKNEGIAVVTIRSILDKSVKLDITIKVIKGISDIELLRSNSDTNLYDKLEFQTSTVYIDEVTNFRINNYNTINNVSYDVNNNVGYILEILDVSTGVININGKDYSYIIDGANRYLLKTNNLNIKGVKIGSVRFKLTPCIILDDIDCGIEYLALDDSYSKEYEIISSARARSVEIDKDSLKIAAKNSTGFKAIIETSNVIFSEDKSRITILSPLKVIINSKEFVIECNNTFDVVNEIDGVYTVDFDFEVDYQLIRLKFTSFSVQSTDVDFESSRNTYKIIFEVSVLFNENYYRANANQFDLNEITFPFKFVPGSNSNVSDTILISISPAELTEIFTDYYSKGELLINSDYEVYPNENTSNFVIPGRSGLLKITLDEEFDDSSYIEVTLNNSYKEYVSIYQMSGRIEKNIKNDGNIELLTENITSYQELAFNEIINESGYYGIRLSKLTLNYQEQDYFNKTYFVKVNLDRDYGGLQNIQLTITPYKKSQPMTSVAKTVTLQVTQLPLVDVKVDNEYSANIGLGVKKEINVAYSGITKDINFVMSDDNNGKIYICDENGNKVVNSLSIEYLNASKKYYLCADVTSSLMNISIDFSVQEMVLGIRENAKSNLNINTVAFEIEDVTIDRAVDGVITLKHGQQLILATNIKYKDIVVGNKNDIANYKTLIEEQFEGIVSLSEYAIAGTNVSKFEGTQLNSLVNSTLRLQYAKYVNSNKVYQTMEVGKNYDYVSLIEGSNQNSNYLYHYYLLKGTSITRDNEPVELRLVVHYYYDNGKMVIDNDMLGYETLEIDIKVVVEDNSTYDHPNPIESADELITACNSNGGDYILVNNITLKNWTPIDTLFDSLDGNGYTITIESFNLSALRGGNDVNVGIFSTTSENTLLKNIIVDVKYLLKTESEMLQDVNKVANSNQENYIYNNNLDLAYTNGVNFGILVGRNNGSITNAKIINTKSTYNITSDNSSNRQLYLHIMTTQGYIDSNFVTTNIGGLVGINSETGAITNSFIGLNISTIKSDENTTDQKSYVKAISNPNNIIHNNENDEMEDIEIYPFVLAGGNNLAGLVAENSGIISNSYAKAVGLYNTYPAVKDSKTAGLVAINDGTITSAFTESAVSKNYRAIEDNFIIESTGNIGGLVYENNAIIENSYVNAYLETQSAFTGGFVFQNNANGSISKSYTTAVNRNSLAHGQFTGVAMNGRDILNYGNYVDCYYLVTTENEIENKNESSKAIKTIVSDISQEITWNGFSFATAVNEDGIWVISSDSCPKIATTMIDTYSFRRLTDSIKVEEEINNEIITYTIYNYDYIGNNLGSQSNPLIIDKAEHFDKYIIDNGFEVDVNGKKEYVFGINNQGNYLSSLNTVGYVRLVNNLDFENITTAVKHNNKYLYNIIFAGVLDGNGMTLNNLNINTDTVQLENFGLFAQVGINSEISQRQTVVKNLNMNLRTYKSSDSSRAGVLAGTIINSNIINVKINGTSSTQSAVVVGARNMAGALAGLIYADSQGTISLYDIIVENVVIESSYGSLNGELTADSIDLSNGLYNKFSVKTVESPTPVERSFTSLYNIDENRTELYANNVNGDKIGIRNDISYSGAVAGVILANNYSIAINNSNNYSNYRTMPDANTIDNIVVRNDITIRTADNAGGLFGYVGENTLIKNSKFVIGGNQLLRAFNFAGGIVAENHGVIESCFVAQSDSIQEEIDRNIVLDNRNSGEYLLFDMVNSNDYSVAIGGIAGYSANGVIIDSYSKINVLKSHAYIAGGIIGYSENYNYLAYSYNTGAVYGKFVIGGLVGLQVNTDTQNLVMYNDVALTDWNYTNNNVNYRQEITAKLYDNQKILYLNNGNYLNFYVKMPEIGNLSIDNLNSAYETAHSNYYVGSVVGKAILNNATTVDGNGKYIGQKLIADLSQYHYDMSENVISNTLGIYTQTGSLASGNKVDSYFGSKFSYLIGANSSIDLFSYRIAYKSNESINAYENASINLDTTNEYFDIFNYPQVWIQEYTQQIVGSYSNIIGSSNLTTRNLFMYDYVESSDDDISRYNTSSNGSAFINSQSDKIWGIEGYLPEFNDGTYVSMMTIADSNGLENALNSTSTGITYKIIPNNVSYDIECDIADSKLIKYTTTMRDTFVGINDDNGNMPKLIFTIDNISAVNTLISIISGGIFENIEFEINYNCNLESDKEYSAYGLISNNLQNASITNCKISLNIANDIKLGKVDGLGVESYFNASSIGLMFGTISNSVLTGNEFVVNASNIEIDNENIENVGLFAGSITNTNILDNKFTFSVGTIELSQHGDLNLGVIAGLANYSTYSNNIVQGNVNIVDASEKDVANIGGVFGYSNNSTVSNFNISNGLTYTTNSNSNSNTINISLISGLSYSTRYSNITINNGNSLEFNGQYQIKSLNIGGIIGLEQGNSVIGANGQVGNSNNIVVEANSINLSVGGLVGYASNSINLINNAFNNSTIQVKNIGIGIIQNGEVSDYAKTFVGGMIGMSSGVVGIKNVYTSGLLDVTLLVNEDSILSGIGGVVGRIVGNIELSNFVSLCDFNINGKTNDADVYNETYVSGIVGLNNGLFKAYNGYSYVELPKESSIISSSITNNSISNNCSNVFYCQEFVGNNYDSDSNFNHFAMADIYGTLNDLSRLYVLLSENFTIDNVGSVQLLLPNGLTYENTNVDGTRFKPIEIKVVENLGVKYETLSEGYYVLLDDVNLESLGFSIGINNGIISGRTTENGKVVINVNTNTTTYTNAIKTNNGVISNIYLNLSKFDEVKGGQNVSLVDENNGLITNVYVYGYTMSQISIANQNNDRIYQSASSTVYVGNSSEIYGLVNNNDGIISDCYSTNFGYTPDKAKQTTVYGLVNTNNGEIYNSAYYINETISYDNIVSGFAKTIATDSVGYNVNNSKLPAFVNSRRTIWSEENGHMQLNGFKDVNGAIVVRLKMTNGSDIITSLDEMTTKARQKYSEYKFIYELDFFVSEDEIPEYSVVKIESASEFTQYMNSLTNNYIPENTIVIIDSNESLRINSLKSFSIPRSSMFIGINDGAVIEYDGSSDLNNEIITYNYGVISGITFANFRIYNNNANKGKFAPILNNYGTIYNVHFDELYMNGGDSRFVAGLVSSNWSNGIINECTIDDYTLYSVEYLNLICTTSTGKVYNCNALNGSTISGSLYGSGNNGGYDND